jgi:hypothetical protein
MLKGNGLLTPNQTTFLEIFAQIPDQERFFLTGGTALAEYYLGHRLSFDLDFFTGEAELIAPISYQIEALCSSKGLQLSVIRRFASYVELLLGEGGESLKIDLALDSPFRFESPVLAENGIKVNDFKDLRIDKILAYYGRAEPRDAVDLYFLLKDEAVHPLLDLAAQKDPGFDLYWMAVALNRVKSFPDEIERWPVKMLIPFDPVQLKNDFQNLALELMKGLTKKQLNEN